MSPTGGGCLTCTGTFGSGARIGGQTVCQADVWWIRKAPHPARTACSVGAVGSATQLTAGRRLASSTATRSSGTTSSVSVLPWPHVSKSCERCGSGNYSCATGTVSWTRSTRRRTKRCQTSIPKSKVHLKAWASYNSLGVENEARGLDRGDGSGRKKDYLLATAIQMTAHASLVPRRPYCPKTQTKRIHAASR